MKLWAYGTSPHGLGLQPDRFWTLTIREFQALKSVHRSELMRWAIEQASFHNLNFLARDSQGRPTEEPWKPEDFLGEGNRQDRNDERQFSTMAAAQANAALANIIAGAPPSEDIPEWAVGAYHG